MEDHTLSDKNNEGEKRKMAHNEHNTYFDPAVNFASLTLIDIAREVSQIRKPPIFHHLKTSTSIVGLGANAHVKIDDPATIQGEHCVVMFRDGQYWIYPREGTVFANGSQVTHDGIPLENGSQIKLGSATLIFFATRLNNNKVVASEPVKSPTPEPAVKQTPLPKAPEESFPDDDHTIRKREEILKQVYSEWTTDKLHKELKTERSNYEDIAITLMEEELERRETSSPIECPRCGVINPGSARRCDCSYNFQLPGGEAPVEKEPGKRAHLDDDETILQPPPSLLDDDGLVDDEGFFQRDLDGTKLCPMCGRSIKEQAIKCRHCGSYLDDDILRHAPAKKINPNLYTASLWGGALFFFPGLFLVQSYDTEAIGAILILIGVAGFSYSIVYTMISLFRCWSVLQGLPARTTPGKAVGFLFIPFYSLYWVFVSIRGLALDANEYLKRRNMHEPQINEGLSLTTSIIFVIPYVSIIVPIFINILIYQWARFYNQVTARSGMGHDSDRPTTGFY